LAKWETPELAALYAKKEDLLDRHTPLLYHQDHDGANHCMCPIAREYRAVSSLYWELREKLKPKNAKALKQAAALSEARKET